MSRISFWALSLSSTFIFIGCATEPRAPQVVRYLMAHPAAQHANQVEVLKDTVIQLRSGDYLVEAQAQYVAEAVGIEFYFINLADKPVRLKVGDFSVIDAEGKTCRSLSEKDVVLPLQANAAALEKKPSPAKEKEDVKSADAIVNPSSGYTGGSTDMRVAQTLRAEAQRLAKSLTPSFVSANVPVNKKIGGMVYFQQPPTWPITLFVHVEDQTLAMSFSPS